MFSGALHFIPGGDAVHHLLTDTVAVILVYDAAL